MKLKFPGIGALGAAIAIVGFALPAAAHHSFAMFDREKTATVEGTVKRFQWANPHSWIILTVTDAAGQAVDWPIEMGSPRGLIQDGWTPKTLTPGMKVSVLLHPLKDEGKPGGQFMMVTLPDGKQLGDPNPPTPE